MIREIYDFSKKYITEAKKEDGTVKFSAPFIQIDKPTRNKTVYHEPIMKNAIDQYMKKVKEGRGWSTPFHPKSGEAEIPDISHRITNLFIKDGVGYVEGQILKGTQAGDKILTMVKSGGTIGLSLRGFGSTTELKNGTRELNSDYVLAGIDFVPNPSEPTALVNQSSIFESAPIIEEEKQKPKFDVSLSEFNNHVDDMLRHAYYDLIPMAGRTEEGYEKYADENWQKYADKVEKILSPLKIEELPKGTEKKVQGEIYTDEQRAYDEALLGGYDRNFETFKEEIFPAIETSKEEENLRAEFSEYKASGGLRSWKEFKKLQEKK